jgi:hypothetical protein
MHSGIVDCTVGYAQYAKRCGIMDARDEQGAKDECSDQKTVCMAIAKRSRRMHWGRIQKWAN